MGQREAFGRSRVGEAGEELSEAFGVNRWTLGSAAFSLMVGALLQWRFQGFDETLKNVLQTLGYSAVPFVLIWLVVFLYQYVWAAPLRLHVNSLALIADIEKERDALRVQLANKLDSQ